MPNYNYVDTTGAMKTTTANNSQEALSGATGIAPSSGVQLNTGTAEVPTTVPVGSVINPAPGIQTPQAPVSQAQTALSGLIASQNAQALASQNVVDTGLTDIQKLSDTLGGQTADSQALEAQYGLPQQQKELSDLNTLQQQQLGQYISSYNQAEAARNTRQETGVVEQNLQRQHAVDALLTSSLISAKQGNIQTAQANVDRALALKYEPIKQALETKKYIIDQMKGKAAADAKNKFDLQLKQVEKEEKNDKDIQDTIIDAINGGAPTELVTKAQKAKSPAEAAAILGRYSSAALDRKYKEAQIANVYSEIAKRNADAVKANQLKNFVTPPIINPQTGKTDPLAQLTSVIDATGAKDNVQLQSILGVVSATQKLAENNPEGTFKGLSPLPRLTPGIFKSQEQISNKGDIEAINLKVQQWASGAALTDAQTKQVNKMTPRKGDSDNEVKKKLNTLTNFMLSQVSSTLASQGIPYKPQTVDYFSSGLSNLSNDELLNTLPSTSTTLSNNQSFFDSLTPIQ